MRVFVAQINPTIGDFSGNSQKIVAAIDRARASLADIVLFPELALCGYPPQDLLFHDAFIDQVESCLKALAPLSQGLMVVLGVVRRNPHKGEKPLHNSAAILIDGMQVGFYDKQLLPTYDVFDERRYFEPGKTPGFWEFKGKRIGVTICEDIWQPFEPYYQNDPVAELAPFKLDVLLNLSSSPYHAQKPDRRIHVCQEAARRVGCPLIMACQVGGNDQLLFDGTSSYVSGKGDLLQVAKSFEEDDLIIDLNTSREPITFKSDPLQQLCQALVLGTRDYFHKQGFSKACLGLSGGIDSALAACIAVQALGKENVLGVSMPSPYSSEGSVKDAQALAGNLGIAFRKIPMELPFQAFRTLLATDLGEKEVGITEENLQARIRGMILMALSNQYGYILLSTGNKSEMAVGYCTLYGDMAGGLALISDVTKRQVYALSKWLNREKEVIPINTILKEPSAELRPNQLDSDSLPAYDIVDAVVSAYVEEYLDIDQIASEYKIPREVVEDLVHRIHKAEYKRRQAPPGIRVSRKAFRVGRDYPIVQKWM